MGGRGEHKEAISEKQLLGRSVSIIIVFT